MAVLRCSEIDKDSARCVKLRLPPTGQNYLSKGFGEVSHIKTINIDGRSLKFHPH